MTSEIERFEQTSLHLFSQAGDGVQVSDALIEHYLPRLRAFVRVRIGEQLRLRETDSDIVQSICRVLLCEDEQPEFPSEAHFRAWLFTAALNKIRMKGRFWNQQRRSKDNEATVDSKAGFDQLFEGYSGVFTPSRIASAREQVERIENAMEQLTEEHREVIALARVARLPYAQVGERMGRSPDAVRQLLGRALINLSQLLARPPSP